MALATGAALGIAPVAVPILTLGAICQTLRKDRIEVKVRAAHQAAAAALKASREHAPAIARASTLIALEGPAITLDPAVLHTESSKGATGFNDRLANQLADGIRFQPDDGAARDVVVLIFTACIAQIRADGDFHTAFTQQMLLDAAQANKVQISLLKRIEEKVDDEAARAEGRHAELVAMIQDFTGRGVNDKALIELARRVRAGVDSPQDAMRELESAVEIALKVQAEGAAGSNLGEFVSEVLRRVADLSAQGQYDDAARAIDEALAEEEAKHLARATRLLDAGLKQDLLRGDAPSAAARLVKKADLEAGGRAEFQALRALQEEWRKRGRDKGLLRDQEVSIALAERVLARAEGSDQRGAALNDLGISLTERGERDADPARLEAAVAAYEAALEEWTRDRVPPQWATTQNNLGNALSNLGTRTSDPSRLEAAVAAYRGALEERTPDRVPLGWAMTQNNLGNVLQTLGTRTDDPARLVASVAAYEAALEERTRDRVPLQWAMTQGNLATLKRARFDLSGDPAHLDAAESHLAAAREVFEQAGATHYLAIADNVAEEIAERRTR